MAFQETDDSSAKYVADDCSFLIHAPKKTPGEIFEGLDMISSLLMPPQSDTRSGPKIEVINPDDLAAPGVDEDEDEMEWYFDQKVPEPPKAENDLDLSEKIASFGYGFAFQDFGVFENFDFVEILDITNPDSVSRSERRILRVEKEKKEFSDHYLADLFQPGEICDFLKADPKWISEPESYKTFTEKEQEILIVLPRKERLKEDTMKHEVFFGLVDILFGYCYDNRINGGELGVESGWTIAKLSATLSCCEKFQSLKEVVICCIRRALCYPLFRHFELAIESMKDVFRLVRCGPVAILKCLLEVRSAFVDSDGRYIFNQIYIEPYCIWLQCNVKKKDLVKLSDSLEELCNSIKKSDLDLDLEEMEHAARIVMEEQEEEETLEATTKKINELTLTAPSQKALDSDDDSSEDSSEDSSDSSDESESDSESDAEIVK